MKIYLATWIAEKSQGDSLTNKSARQRLLSYYLLITQNATKEILNRYIKTGRNSV